MRKHIKYTFQKKVVKDPFEKLHNVIESLAAAGLVRLVNATHDDAVNGGQRKKGGWPVRARGRLDRPEKGGWPVLRFQKRP